VRALDAKLAGVHVDISSENGSGTSSNNGRGTAESSRAGTSEQQ